MPGGAHDPPVETDCDSNANDPDHVVGAQVCGTGGTRDDADHGPTGEPVNGLTFAAGTEDDDTLWVEGAGNLSGQDGGVNAGSGSTAVGVSDDVGTQCNPEP